MQRNSLPFPRFGRLVAFVLSGLVLATACASPGRSGALGQGPAAQASTAPDGTQAITVRVGDGVSFEPSAIVVKAGAPVQLTLQSVGGADHDFTLSEGVARPVKITAKGRQTATGAFTIERAGDYEFVCSVPGHAMAGMRGTIIAQ